MAHIPKRATQHGLYICGKETVPIALKVGQQDLHRKGLYTSEMPDHSDNYLAQDLPHKSEYGRSILSSTNPTHYMEPRRPIMQRSASESGVGHHNTGHWRSDYRSSMNQDSLDGALNRRQLGPHFVPGKEVSCISRPTEGAAYRFDYGRYGSNPRDRIRPEDNKLPVLKSALHAGTAKGTHHIPGFQGHIPSSASAPIFLRGGVPGENTRSNDKSNITQVFHTNLVGYQGHNPTNFANDSGGRKLTDLTTTGRDFSMKAALG